MKAGGVVRVVMERGGEGWVLWWEYGFSIVGIVWWSDCVVILEVLRVLEGCVEAV